MWPWARRWPKRFFRQPSTRLFSQLTKLGAYTVEFGYPFLLWLLAFSDLKERLQQAGNGEGFDQRRFDRPRKQNGKNKRACRPRTRKQVKPPARPEPA